MKILKIELRNYRGVDHRVVEFASSGVTIVEGPNEIGKSSMAEAIDRVIEDMDSTSKQRVVATKPIGRDVGPEVMIEIESGAFAFKYRKRFLRDRLTELEITHPRTEFHTGREAHDRVEAILSETVDMALWRALRIQQGQIVAQAPLVDQTSLSAALDRAAGEAPAGGEEVALFDLAHAEYLAYWTETGRRKGAEIELERVIELSALEIERLQNAVRDIEADVEASVRLEAEAVRLKERSAEHRLGFAAHQARVDDLAKLEATFETLRAQLQAAQLVATEARRVAQARQEAADAIATARLEQETFAREVESGDPQLESAKSRVAAADRRVVDVRAERDEARDRAEVARQRLSRLRDAADLQRLEARAERVAVALTAIHQATEDAALALDVAQLQRIRSDHRALELLRARFEASAPRVTIEATAKVSAVVDGEKLTLAAGARLDHRVKRSLALTVPGALSISMVVGETGESGGPDLEAAERGLADLLSVVGANDVAEAEQLHERREVATRTVADQRRALRESLGDLTADVLVERIASLRTRLEGAGLSDAGAAPADEESLRDSLDAATEALDIADRNVGAAEQEWEAAHKKLSAVELARSKKQTELQLATAEAERLEANLVKDRKAKTDASITSDLQRANVDEAAKTRAFESGKAALTQEGPDEAREKLRNATQTLERVDRETREVQDELLQVTTRLRDRGEDGLAEELQEAVAVHDHGEVELRRYQARAAARKLLYDTLRTERELARKAYVAPLRRQIENLGRIVFGADFEVELDDQDLSITSRSLAGRTVPFSSLSIGAQEQIALLSRLACATIVAPDGGVPIILDDALGNSDPQRLEAMGTALAVAGRQCQVIVLTCQPDRYEHVGGAKVVRLP